MSEIILVSINKGRLSLEVLPWRHAKEIVALQLKSKPNIQEPFLPLDAGYIIVDHDARTILDVQEAFSWRVSLKDHTKKRWQIFTQR